MAEGKEQFYPLTLVCATFWVWANSAGSLASVLGWVQQYSQDHPVTLGQLRVQGARAPLRRGGTT